MPLNPTKAELLVSAMQTIRQEDASVSRKKGCTCQHRQQRASCFPLGKQLQPLSERIGTENQNRNQKSNQGNISISRPTLSSLFRSKTKIGLWQDNVPVKQLQTTVTFGSSITSYRRKTLGWCTFFMMAISRLMLSINVSSFPTCG